LSDLIPLIDRKTDHPSDPIAHQAAIARSASQGRPHRGRRSLVLDRSEHGGTLMASRNGRFCVVGFSIMATLTGWVMISCMTTEAIAESPFANPPVHSATTNPSSDPWAAYIAEAAERFAIPERWIRAVMAVESTGDRTARSRKGAIGLMQIMPKTWNQLHVRYALGNDPWQPRNNILAGAAYLREMHDRYGSIAAMLAAYNAGPKRYDAHLASGRALPAETVEYVGKIAPLIGGTITNRSIEPPATSSSWSQASLFVGRAFVQGDDSSTSSHSPSARSSEDRTVIDLSALVPPSHGLFVQRPPWQGGQR
jgi:hypothetical protein